MRFRGGFFPRFHFCSFFFLSYARLRRPRVDPQLLESLRRKSLVELATLTAYVFQINAIHCFILVVPPSEHSSVSSGNHPSSARHLFFCFFSFTPSSPAVSFPLSREINARRTGEPFLPIPCFENGCILDLSGLCNTTWRRGALASAWRKDIEVSLLAVVGRLFSRSRV